VQALSRPGLLSAIIAAKPLTKFVKTVAPDSQLPAFLSTLLSRNDQTVRADAPERLRKVAKRRRWLRFALVGGTACLLLVTCLGVGMFIAFDQLTAGGELASGRNTASKGTFTKSTVGKTTGGVSTAPAGPALLDALEARSIPAVELFPWQPKELVAVLGKHQGRLWGTTNRLAVSPDGKLIASGSTDGFIHFWDAATLRERDFIREDCNGIASLLFSSDNQTLAIGGNDGNIYLWDAGRVKPTRKLVLKGHRNPVQAMAFSPNRQQLATGGIDEIKLWDVARTESTPVTVGKHQGAVQALAWTHDGQKLLSGGRDKAVRFWELNDTSWFNYFSITDLDDVTELALAAKDERLVIGCHSRDIYVWDMVGKKQSGYAEATKGQNTQGVLSAEAQTLACHINANNPVHVWNVAGAEPKDRGSLGPITQGTTALALTPNGRTLVLAGYNGLQVWDLAAETPRLLTPRQDQVDARTVAFAPDGKTLASGGRNGRIRLWNLGGPEPTERQVIEAHGRQVNDLKYFADGKQLASAGWDGTVKLWDLSPAKPVESGRGVPSNFMVNSLGVTADGKLLASGGMDKNSRVYTIAQGKLTPLGEPLVHADAVTAVALDPKGRFLACGLRETGVVLWDLTGQRPRRRTPDLRLPQPRGAVTSAAIAPDGQTLAVGTSAGSIRFWDVTTTDARERPEASVPSIRSSVFALAYSPDGALLAASYAGKVLLLEASGQKVLRDWELPGTIEDLSFSPDSRHLALANSNGTLYVLRLAAVR